MSAGKKLDINICLRDFKEPNGIIKYPSLFAIPTENRIVELAKKDYAKIAVLISAGLTLAFESMNLARPMKASQIADLAEMIIETSNEDNLAIEDVILFLQKLTYGEYGKLYESIDIPKFMQFFEIYREERWQALRRMREEQDVQYRALPENKRLTTIRDLMTLKKDI